MDSEDQLVSVTELKDYMSGIGLDTDQAEAMQNVLDGLQRELERYCNRPFARKARTEVVYPDDMGRLWPKATPIVSVSDPVDVYEIGPAGRALLSTPWASGYALGGGLAPVTLTYVGGLDPEDDDLEDVKLAILRAAAREATTRHDDVLDPNDLSARKVEAHDKKALGFQDDELKKFDRLRRRTVV